MKKIQILYPEPQMEELKRAAKRLDRPISELVREATAEWLRRHAPTTRRDAREAPPVFSAGSIKVASGTLREESHRSEQH